MFNLELNDRIPIRIYLYSIAGEQIALVSEGTFDQGEHSFDLDVSGMPKGLYLIRFLTGNEIQAFKLVVG